MTDSLKTVQALVEIARLLGATKEKKAMGFYTEQDSRFELAMHKSISSHTNALIAQMQRDARPIAYADKIAFESAMKVGKGCDVWPTAGDYAQRTGREVVELFAAPQMQRDAGQPFAWAIPYKDVSEPTEPVQYVLDQDKELGLERLRCHGSEWVGEPVPLVRAATQPAAPKPSTQGPTELWLQLHGDCAPGDLSEPVDYTGGDVTWCWHKINNSDVRYVRADRAGKKRSDRQKLETLAAAIAAAAQKAGIYNGEMPLTGPHLLQLLDDLASGPLAQPAVSAEARDAKLWRALMAYPGARKRIWNHVFDAEQVRGHESIESVLTAAMGTPPTRPNFKCSFCGWVGHGPAHVCTPVEGTPPADNKENGK